MTAMIERAAKADHAATEAFFRRDHEDRSTHHGNPPSVWRKKLAQERSAAIVLAALDPEDGEMMEVIRSAIWHMNVMSDTGSFAAREVVARLRDHLNASQGE